MRLLLAALLVLAACGFERRSDALTCQVTPDCDDGRTCVQGWCIGGTPPIDGGGGDGGGVDASGDGGGSIDAGPCPAACDRCDGETCVIECTTEGDCSGLVICPAGRPCQVTCSGADSCAGGIDCTQAESCLLSCSQSGSCAGQIICGTGICRAECAGAESCGGGIDCANSCRCDTFCTGVGACPVQPECPGPNTQCTSGNNCTSVPGPCKDC